MTGQRQTVFDTAKALLIILVIAGHILIVLNPGYRNLPMALMQEAIYSFHMPAFFLLHGLLFNRSKWKAASVLSYIGKRAFTLLIPYVFFETIGMVLRMVLYQQSLTDGLLNMLTIRCNVGADWFLPAMFLGSLLFWVDVKLDHPVYGWISAAFCCIVPMFFPKHPLLVVIGRALLACGFITLGRLLKDIFLSEQAKRVPWAILSALIIGACAVLNLKFGGNDFYTLAISNPAVMILGGTAGTFLILRISEWLPSRFLVRTGQNSLIVMGTHQLVIYTMTALLPWMSGGPIWMGLVLAAVILAFETAAVFLLNRFLPFCIGKQDSQHR